MYFADYHTHSKFSFDAPHGKHGEVDSLCDAAIAAGMNEIAITDHYDVNGLLEGICDVCDPAAVLVDVAAAKEKYKGKLTVTYGIELGQAAEYPEHSKELLKKFPFEFVIGSLHNMPGKPDYYTFDFTQFTDEYINDLFEECLGGLMDIAKFEGLSTVAHFTYMHRYAVRCDRDIDFSRYIPQIKEFYRAVIENGKALELNVSTMREKEGFTLPTKDLMKLYRQCGGEMVTVGSDSHGCRDVGAHIKDGYEFLREAGFKFVTLFRDRKPVMQKLD